MTAKARERRTATPVGHRGQPDLPARQRPRLVGAQYVDAGEGLQRVGVADEHPFSGQAPSGSHLGHGGNDGQALRDGGDGQVDGAPEGLGQTLAPKGTKTGDASSTERCQGD